MSEKPPPKEFSPPPGTTRVKLRDLTDWTITNKKWFLDLIKDSFCLIQSTASEISKFGKIETTMQKVKSYQLFGKSKIVNFES